MGCDWYTFTTIKMSGIIFFSKCIPEDIMKKYNIVMIPIPIHRDLNTHEFKHGKFKCFMDTNDVIFTRENKSVVWNNVKEEEVIINYCEDDYEWFCEHEAYYTYIYVKNIIDKTEMHAIGPYDITQSAVAVMYSNSNNTDLSDISIIEHIYDKNGDIHGFQNNLPVEVCDIVLSSTCGSYIIRGLDDILGKMEKKI